MDIIKLTQIGLEKVSSSGGSASDTTYDNTDSGLTATTVQDAIDEVDGNVDDVTTTVASHTTTLNTMSTTLANVTDTDGVVTSDLVTQVVANTANIATNASDIEDLSLTVNGGDATTTISITDDDDHILANKYILKSKMILATSSNRYVVRTDGWQQGDTIVVTYIESGPTTSAAIATSLEVMSSSVAGIESLASGVNGVDSNVPYSFTPDYDFSYVYFSLKSSSSVDTLVVQRIRPQDGMTDTLETLETTSTTLTSDVEDIQDRLDADSPIKRQIEKDTYRPRYVDLLTYTSCATIASTHILHTPDSTTTDTITLTSDDTADLTFTNPINDDFALYITITIRDTNEDYYNIVCSQSDGVLTKVYDWGKDIDLTTTQDFMFLHYDSLHFSPYGYRSFARLIAEQIQSVSCERDNFAAGFVSRFCSIDSDMNITMNDEIVATCTDSNVLTSGNTGISGVSNACGMVTGGNIPKYGGNWAYTCFRYAQGESDAYITWKIDLGSGVRGFALIGIVSPYVDSTYIGQGYINVTDEDGNSLLSTTIPVWIDNLYVDLHDKVYTSLYVTIGNSAAESTLIVINHISVYRDYTDSGIDLDDCTFAVLGSSNTQRPTLAQATEILPDDADNELVEMPDGTSGDGCGYYPKELARVLSCDVGNWGKSGETTDYGFEMLDTVMTGMPYTHIILSLFGNDINNGVSRPIVKARVRRMAEYCKSKGCIPIIIQSYGVAGNVALTYGYFNDLLQYGLDFDE